MFRLLITVVTMSLLAACVSEQPEPGGQETTSRATTGPGGTAPEHTPGSEAGPITISFAGDIHFEDRLRRLLDDPGTGLEPLGTQLSAADLTVVNLESAIGSGGEPAPKRFTFQAPPAAFDALAAAGVDVVTMANNHAMDFGADGLSETLAAARRAGAAEPGLDVVGVGVDADAAFTPAIREVRGSRIAVFGAALPDDPTADPTAHWAAGDGKPGIATALDPAPLLAAVERAAADTDLVVVYLHWGVQGRACPSDSQRALAAALASAGADIIAGSHAHRLQGAGLLPTGADPPQTYVAYGLGNFIWHSRRTEAATVTGVLTVTAAGGRVIDEEWAHARVGADGLPGFGATGTSRPFLERMADLRACAGLEPVTANAATPR